MFKDERWRQSSEIWWNFINRKPDWLKSFFSFVQSARGSECEERRLILLGYWHDYVTLWRTTSWNLNVELRVVRGGFCSDKKCDEGFLYVDLKVGHLKLKKSQLLFLNKLSRDSSRTWESVSPFILEITKRQTWGYPYYSTQQKFFWPNSYY